jgi:16S rRNA processing protein RimM
MITIGIVAGSHGLHGALKVRPTGDFPERFQGLEAVFLKRKNAVAESRAVIDVKTGAGGVLLTLQGLNSPEEARLYQAALVQVTESESFVLPEGYFYHYQLIGLKVYDHDRELGVLQDILETGANDVYVVKGAARDYLLPAIASVIKQVDLGQGRMQVEMLPGLEDI